MTNINPLYVHAAVYLCSALRSPVTTTIILLLPLIIITTIIGTSTPRGYRDKIVTLL